MIAVDTNVLVRYLIDDDPRQGAKAKRLVESAAKKDARVFIGTVILLETMWVLEKAYSFRKTDLISVLEDLLSFQMFALEDAASVSAALESFRNGRADFSDYLSAWKSLAAAKSKLYTFDNKCRENTLFAIPP